jgi:hypothetical protein
LVLKGVDFGLDVLGARLDAWPAEVSQEPA